MATEIEGVGMDKISDDFKKMHAELKRLEKSYNPQNENLHFTTVELADTKLYSALLSLGHRGLQTVRKHHNYLQKTGFMMTECFGITFSL
ncbi:MAG: hypothetical protein ACM3SR_15860 [Ignavibacteriales bacterium]